MLSKRQKMQLYALSEKMLRFSTFIVLPAFTLIIPTVGSVIFFCENIVIVILSYLTAALIYIELHLLVRDFLHPPNNAMLPLEVRHLLSLGVLNRQSSLPWVVIIY